MESKVFMDLVDDQVRRCKRVLEKRATIYAPGDDRLAQFKAMAAERGSTATDALSGAMSKHTSTLHHILCGRVVVDEKQIVETITDTMNYCLLALGLVMEK